jgi:hypothetical protein
VRFSGATPSCVQDPEWALEDAGAQQHVDVRVCSDAPDALEHILRHCHAGGALTVANTLEAAKEVQMLTEHQLDKLQKHEEQNGAAGEQASAVQQLQALLVLLSSWHAACLHAENFHSARQICATLIAAKPAFGEAASLLLDKYIQAVQQLCKKMHGFVLDVR